MGVSFTRKVWFNLCQYFNILVCTQICNRSDIRYSKYESYLGGINMCTRTKLAEIAKAKALLPFNGILPNREPNIHQIIRFFPRWSIEEADRNWCAAFVYYCCVEAGFHIPVRPKECISCNLAGCGAWEEFALGDERMEYHPGNEDNFSPEPGDIVIYDRVFIDCEHDHIGIVLENKKDSIITAEGNTYNDNISRILERDKDEHIRAYIRIPNYYSYSAETESINGLEVQ